MNSIKRFITVLAGTAVCLTPLLSITVANAEEEKPGFSTFTASENVKPIPEQSVFVKFLPDGKNLQVLQDNSWKTPQINEDNVETNTRGVFYGYDTAAKQSHTLNSEILKGPYESIYSTGKYVAVYTQGRNAKSASIVILDATTGKTVSTMDGFAKFPDSTALTALDESTFYAAKGSNLYKINAEQGNSETSTIEVSKGQSLTSPQINKGTKTLYLLQKGFKASSLRAWNLSTNTLVSDFNVDLANPNVEGFSAGAKPRQILLDEAKNRIYVLYSPAPGGNNPHFLVTYNLKTQSFVGKVMPLGSNTVDLKLHPTSHEVIAVSSYDNSIYVANPGTFESKKALDLNDYVVPADKADASAAGKANLYAISLNNDGTKAYALSPFPTALIGKGFSTAIEVNITPAADVVPNEDQSPTPPPEPNAPEKPKDEFKLPEPVKPVLEGHDVKIKDSSLSWGFSDYAKLYWEDKVDKNVERINPGKTDATYKFTKGTGLANSKTGETVIAYEGTVTFKPYSFIPGMSIVFSNPVYERDKVGNEKVTFDMYWDLGSEKPSHSESFKRVSVAVSAKPTTNKLKFINGESISFPIAYDNVTYTDAKEVVHTGAWPTEFIDNFIADMRPWWYKTGASRDEDKKPNPLSISLINVEKDSQDSSDPSSMTNREKLEKLAKDNADLVGNSTNPIRCDLRENGCVQSFKDKDNNRHAAYVSDVSSGIVKLNGAIGKYFSQNGWENGKLGYPVNTEKSVGKQQWIQEFENAYVTYSANGIAVSYKDHAITKYYKENMENLFPLNSIKCGLKNKGCVQTFIAKDGKRFAVYVSNSTPVTPIQLNGAIGYHFSQNGWENGKLGYPVNTEKSVGKQQWIQEFENAYVTYSANGIAVSYKDHAITKYYKENMENLFPLNSIKCGLKNKGCVQSFINKSNEKYAVYSHSGKTISVNLSDNIAKHWISSGWENGKLGYPVSERENIENGYKQQFEHGTVVFQNDKLTVE